jgi:hypothetical protein
MKRTAMVLIGATVVLGGGALVMDQAFASSPAAVTQHLDTPSSSQHDASDDRVTGIHGRATHDTNDDRVSGVDDGAHRASDAVTAPAAATAPVTGPSAAAADTTILTTPRPGGHHRPPGRSVSAQHQARTP